MTHTNTSTSSLSKKQLALLYAPTLTMNAALNRLARWLHHNPDLWQALLATGYTTRQRNLTAKQVAIIYDYLGEP